MSRSVALGVATLLAAVACSSTSASAPPVPTPARDARVSATTTTAVSPPTTAVTTTAVVTSSTTTPTTPTTTSTTTTVPASTTSTVPAPLPPPEPGDVAVWTNDDPAMPMTVRVPTIANRPFFNDVINSWATTVRVDFRQQAGALIRERERRAAEAQAAAEAAAREAAEAAAAAAAASTLPGDTTTTTTTTTTLPPPPPPPPPRLDVDVDGVTIGPGYATARLRTSTLLDGPTHTANEAFYAFDDGQVVASRALLAPERIAEFVGLVAARLGDRVGDWNGVAFDALLTDVMLTDAGDLRVTVPTRHLAAGADPAPVVIPAEEATQFLSRLGMAVVTGEPPPARAASPVDCDVARCVALTFDDGPTDQTARLLDHLDRADEPATFFVLGRLVESNPDLTRRIVDSGHAIGNHTWTHDNLRALSLDDVIADLSRTNTAIAAATGVVADYMRPPYGAYELETRYIDYGFALWDVDTRDWDHRSPGETVRRTVRDIEPGSVVLMHDIHGATVDAVPLMIAQLRADGYELVTLPELFGPAEHGALYYSHGDVEPPPPPTTTTTTTTTVPATTPEQGG